jgi:hypothetical protein
MAGFIDVLLRVRDRAPDSAQAPPVKRRPRHEQT